MPNVGRPSRDCHSCRQRRAKCDLTKPECRKCVRSGRKCPGYRSEQDLMFRVEDCETIANSSTRDRRRKYQPDGTLKPSTPPHTNGSELLHTSKPTGDLGPVPVDEDVILTFAGWYISPAKGLAECWDNHAMPLFLSRFCSSRNAPQASGFLEFLPDMIHLAAPTSSLVSACRAIAFALFAHHLRTREAHSRRAGAYGIALQATNRALADPVMQVQDETLTSVWLLSMYEVIVGSIAVHQRPGSIGWDAHLQGLITLLRLRSTGRLKTSTERNLFFMTYHTIQTTSFVAGIACPPDSLVWFSEIEKNISNEDRFILEVSRYGFEASTISAKILQTLNAESKPGLSTVQGLLLDTDSLQERSTNLSTLNTERFGFPSGQFNACGYAPGCDLRTITIRTLLFAYRLKLLLSQLQLVSMHSVLHLSPRYFRDRCRQTTECIHHTADEILAVKSALFHRDRAGSGSIGGYEFQGSCNSQHWTDGIRVLWPLKMVAAWEVMRPEQKTNALTTLRYIREELCIENAAEVSMHRSPKS